MRYFLFIGLVSPFFGACVTTSKCSSRLEDLQKECINSIDSLGDTCKGMIEQCRAKCSLPKKAVSSDKETF